jgi:WhiB family transcriptional regulator, redox-sensing transcriptional regulator
VAAALAGAQEGELTTVVRDAHWTAYAACGNTGKDRMPPEAMFVEGPAQREARSVCTTCAVRLECLAEALDNRLDFGVWGGMTERERRALRRRRPEVESWWVELTAPEVLVAD